jgi:hypothetical protein
MPSLKTYPGKFNQLLTECVLDGLLMFMQHFVNKAFCSCRSSNCRLNLTAALTTWPAANIFRRLGAGILVRWATVCMVGGVCYLRNTRHETTYMSREVRVGPKYKSLEEMLNGEGRPL